MSQKHLSNNYTTPLIRIVCAVLFVVFCASFLAVQSALLEAMQHLFSAGRTSYSPLWGTIISTVVLLLLQILMAAVSRFVPRLHAWSYLPSFFLLAFMTDHGRALYEGSEGVHWLWLTIATLLLYALLLVINRRFAAMSRARAEADVVAQLWPNVATLILFSLLTIANTDIDPLFQNEIKVERDIRKGAYERALGEGCDAPTLQSRQLSALRSYAMSRLDTLGCLLFEYPQPYGIEGLLIADEYPTASFTQEDIYHYLQARPFYWELPTHYLARICNEEIASHPALDYYLCALLLERRVSVFVHELQEFYDIDETTPKHYLEALALYHYYKPNYQPPFDLSEFDANYRDYRANPMLYPHTYWHYYHNK